MPELPALDLIRRLVGFDTTSRNSNLALIDFVREYLDGHGVTSELVFDATGTKANLYATIGPEDRGGLLLAGHSDVVPVDDQDWHSDPFDLRVDDARLTGRGAADMKSFIALVLARVPLWASIPLKTPLHLAFTYDEEVGCLGATRLAEAIGTRAVKPAACIIGEPTSMRPVTGHKGRMSVRTHVHGRECHSSQTHEGVNAIEAAAALIVRLRAMAERRRQNGPFDPALQPPYTTIQTGLVQGGSAVNIVPRFCVFDSEFRFVAGDDGETLLAELREYAETALLPGMHAVDPATGIDFTVTSAVAALSTSDDAEIARLVQRLTGANETARVSFGTEGGVFQAAGIPTIVCGPGSIDQAHKPDEWIATDQIVQCDRFLERLTGELAA